MICGMINGIVDQWDDLMGQGIFRTDFRYFYWKMGWNTAGSVFDGISWRYPDALEPWNSLKIQPLKDRSKSSETDEP
jgi:hypothetical protein